MKMLQQAIFFILIIVLQFSIFPRLSINYFEPDLLLAVIVLMALHKSPETACAIGFIIGLLQDVNSGVIMGSNAFIWTQLAMMNAMLRNYVFIDSIPVQIVMVGGSSILAGVLYIILHQLAVMQEPMGQFLFLTVCRTLTTALITWPINRIMLRLGLIAELRHA
ncbi:rod shape-determining protein MreD [bacterium]|nr:rod shape-determining protein MreD [candidate division CSSED10-310 bacterium]